MGSKNFESHVRRGQPHQRGRTLEKRRALHGGGCGGASGKVLQALAAWRQSFFEGVHAVHAETQTTAQLGGEDQGDQADRGTKSEKLPRTPKRKWIFLHGVDCKPT